MAGPAAILLWESGAAQQKIADRVRGRKAQSKDGINRYDRRRGKLAAGVLPKAKKGRPRGCWQRETTGTGPA